MTRLTESKDNTADWSSAVCLLVSHDGDPCSIPGHAIGICGRQTSTGTSYGSCSFPLPVSFHRCPLFVKSSISDAQTNIWSGIYLFIYSFIHVRDVRISQMHSVQVTVFSHSVTVHQPTTTAGQSHTIRGRQSDRRLSESRCWHPLFIFIKL
jgi:hypothetical protein